MEAKDLDEYLADLLKKSRRKELAKKISSLKESRLEKASKKPSSLEIPTQILERKDPLLKELEDIFMEGL